MTLKEMVKLAVNGVSKDDALKYDSLGLDVDTIIEAKKNNVDIADLASALEQNLTESDGEAEGGSDGSHDGDESNNEGTGEGDSTDFEKLYKEEHEKLVALQEKNSRKGSEGDEKSLEETVASIFKEW